ncbi:hypothetical protein EX30DRAFT_349870 [Ascodesmis nigricans]|uniref:Uncharacterized protein n=1 Tax=Ascodesmis nigricans TaxID=341454 RepID=A0A4S2MTV0_9PEZI|nr:hypothetical protein EX30DRAFT_349870 [Ascodesmis nigricans]
MSWRFRTLHLLALAITSFTSTTTAYNPRGWSLPPMHLPSIHKRAQPSPATPSDVVLIPLPATLLTGLSKRSDHFSDLQPNQDASFWFGAPLADWKHKYPQLIVDRPDCRISGAVTFTGHLRVENGLNVKDPVFEVDPEDIESLVELNIRKTQSLQEFTISPSSSNTLSAES